MSHGSAPARRQAALALGAAAVLAFFAPRWALAQAVKAPGVQWQAGVQTTVVDQSDPGLTSPFRGANSLSPAAQSRETVDATLYAGLSLWRGDEIFLSPEIDQGFGLSDTLGIAGFPSAEAYKIGQATPYIRVQRFFLRQTFDLGGATEPQDHTLTSFTSRPTHDRLVFTLGKFAVGDVFDTNTYAHDPRQDFLNWSLVATGTFDYAADPWGYTYGAAAEAYLGQWVLRGGVFNLSTVPNGVALETDFSQFELAGEVERRYRLWKREGKLRVTAYLNRGRYGDYVDAVRLAEADGGTPELSQVRRYRGHAGVGVNWEQPVTDNLGVFVRAGYADGHQQTYEYTDVDRTVGGGVSLQGRRWGRPDDTVGVAGAVNDISEAFRAYLAAGGLGLLIGDGQLPHYQSERLVETYYSLALFKDANLSFDYQFIANPGYDRDRGPASVFGVRLHLQAIAGGR